MAKRTRKQRERTVVRRAGVAAPATTQVVPDGAAVAPRPVPPIPAGRPGEGGARRRVERVGGPASGPTAVAAPVAVASITAARPRTQRHQPAGFIEPLESADPAIPFNRVPYVPADLRRVAIIATVMIALIIVADIIVNNVVK